MRVHLHADLSEDNRLFGCYMPTALQFSWDPAQHQGCSRWNTHGWHELGRSKGLTEKLFHLTPDTLSTGCRSSSQITGRSKTDRVSGKPVNDQFLAFHREPGANFG